MKAKNFISLDLHRVAGATPHLLERFSRVALNAEKAGVCSVLRAGFLGDIVLFNCEGEDDSAESLFEFWVAAGIPKSALRLYSSAPSAYENKANASDEIYRGMD